MLFSEFETAKFVWISLPLCGQGNKVRVHPIPFSTHLSCLLKVFFRIESSVIHDSKVSVLEPADEMTR